MEHLTMSYESAQMLTLFLLQAVWTAIVLPSSSLMSTTILLIAPSVTLVALPLADTLMVSLKFLLNS